MSKLILTRFLYIYDEVGFSFITTLLKKQSLTECYFWISELFLSGFEKKTWELLWFIYYDFYYIYNPQFIRFIFKKHKSGNLRDLLTVVKNLFTFRSSSEIFITRQYNMAINNITHIFRGKKPNWLITAIPLHYHALFRFIDKKLYHFAVSSLPKTVEPDLFDAIQIYFNLGNTQIEELKKNYYGDSGTGTDVDNGEYYDNNHHKIWAIICLLIFNPDYIKSKKKMFIGIHNSDYNNIIKIHNDPIPLDPSSSSSLDYVQIRKTLPNKCLYSIHPLSSSFSSMRDEQDNISECYWYHWEYYAYHSPIWKERFDEYNITIDDDCRKISFNDDDELEDFYEQYGYEPDEQSSETQNKLFGCLPKNNWKKWIEDVFSNHKCIYDFENDFKFYY